MAGFRLPISSHVLQAMVSEPIKPVLNTVITSGLVHVYVSQSDKGELVFGAGIDTYNSYSQAGSPPITEGMLNALTDLFPIFSRLRFLRQWGGIVDTCPDASPIIGQNAGRELVPQLRLGHRRLQGDARLRLRLCTHHRDRRAAPARRTVLARALLDRLPDRRAWRVRRGALIGIIPSPPRFPMSVRRCSACSGRLRGNRQRWAKLEGCFRPTHRAGQFAYAQLRGKQ